MYAYDSMSYWDAYMLPIPIRKWLIDRYQEQIKVENKTNNRTTDTPLTKTERQKTKREITQTNNNGFANIMQGMRNK